MENNIKLVILVTMSPEVARTSQGSTPSPSVAIKNHLNCQFMDMIELTLNREVKDGDFLVEVAQIVEDENKEKEQWLQQLLLIKKDNLKRLKQEIRDIENNR